MVSEFSVEIVRGVVSLSVGGLPEPVLIEGFTEKTLLACLGVRLILEIF